MILYFQLAHYKSAGYEAGCGTVIHAMHTIFEDEKTEAVLLVGAANAFNSVNRQDFLHNI